MARTSSSIGAEGRSGQTANSGRLPLWLRAFTVASLVGVLLALSTSYIHGQLDRAGADYVSFCNLNERVNCDAVLGSRFARAFGIPIAWLAVLTHLGLAGLAAACRARGRPSLGSLRLLVLGGIGAAVFSSYMALVSFSVLQTACLMCMGLYAVSAAQAALALAIARGWGLPRQPLFGALPLSAIAVGMVIAMALAGRFLWPGADSPPAGLTLAELRATDPAFYDWYVEQPVSRRPNQAAAANGQRPTPVVILEFSDFECAYCRLNRSMAKEVRALYPELVQLVHRSFPLDPACNEAVERSMHPNACRAAEAAECAERQGRYDAMASVLFENQDRLFEANLPRLAERAGLDLPAFVRCMENREALAKVVADSKEGARLQINSTPTLFINGRRIVGTFDSVAKYALAVLVEARLAAGDTLPAAASPH